MRFHVLFLLDAASPDEAQAAIASWTITPGAWLYSVEAPAHTVFQGGETAPPISPSRRLDSVTPVSGPEAGDTEITLKGVGFTNIGGVRFEGEGNTAWAASFEVVDDETLTCPTPPGTGVVDVIAFNGDPGDARLAAAFTYEPVAGG